jgi:hypothetical protein
MQRFPSVLLKGFASNFIGKDGAAALSRLCRSCRMIDQIDVVEVGFVAADLVKSESDLINLLDIFDSLCAPGAVLQGRTNCSMYDFTRFCFSSFLCRSRLPTHSARQVSASFCLKRMDIAILEYS